MKIWIKVLAGLALFGGGFCTGFIVHKKLNDVEFEEVSKEEMALLEKQAEAEQKTDPEPFCKANVKDIQELPSDPDKMRMSLQGKVSYIQADQEAKEHYAKIWNTVKDYSNEENADEFPIETTEEGFDEDFLEMLEEEQVEPGQVEPPHQISLVEFYNERSEYDKITIEWYEPNTWLDEKEEVIADLKAYIGDIDPNKLFERNSYDDEPDVRFVRNEKYGTDYEIIRHHRSWSETTGGSE